MKTTFDSIIEKYNERNEFVTKIWVWIAIISIFGIVIISQKPRPNDKIPLSEIGKTELINFPIIDIPVPSKYFVLIYTILLTGLLIRWVEAFRRSSTFRQNVIEPLVKKNQKISIDGDLVDSRSILDGMVYSTTTSVWGIVPDYKNKNDLKSQRRIRGLVYISLKVIVFFAHFLLPLVALFTVAISSINSKTPELIVLSVLIFLLVATLVIVRAAISEWQYSSNPWRQQIQGTNHLTKPKL